MKQLILSLDVQNKQKACDIINAISEHLAMVKIGHVALSSINTKDLRDIVKDIPLFLDMKFFDIPNTIIQAIEGYSNTFANLKYFTFFGLMQRLDIIKLVEVCENTSQKISPIAVLILSSDKVNYQEFLDLAQKNYECGIRNFVCPVAYIKILREKFPDVVLFTPGVRSNMATHDHTLTCNAKEAINWGANYIIVGRPLIESKNLLTTIKEYI